MSPSPNAPHFPVRQRSTKAFAVLCPRSLVSGLSRSGCHAALRLVLHGDRQSAERNAPPEGLCRKRSSLPGRARTKHTTSSRKESLYLSHENLLKIFHMQFFDLTESGFFYKRRLFATRGSNSVVECNLAKVEVAGSNPVSRSSKSS